LAWDSWASAKIIEHLNEYDRDIAAPAHNELIQDLDKSLDIAFGELDQLRKEVAELRAELTVMQGIQRGNVSELKTRSGDAA